MTQLQAFSLEIKYHDKGNETHDWWPHAGVWMNRGAAERRRDELQELYGMIADYRVVPVGLVKVESDHDDTDD